MLRENLRCARYKYAPLTIAPSSHANKATCFQSGLKCAAGKLIAAEVVAACASNGTLSQTGGACLGIKMISSASGAIHHKRSVAIAPQ